MADTIHLGSPTSRGIASTSALGSPTASPGIVYVQPTSITSTLTFGSPQVNMTE
jgi:hypothetical protein